MRTRLIGGIAALAIALGALAFPSAEPAQARSTCTGWTSALVPPTSIRVYRTATKRTQSVPFRTYVETVMAAEWGATAPAAALRVGAVAVKQFAWYYAMHWRGGKDPAGRCYDVVDSSMDQIYNPTRKPATSHRAAVTATWRVSLRKGDRFFLTGYRPGTGSCTAHIDGWKLYQRDAVDCVRRYGDTAEELARRFYSSVSWITPGAGDFTADGRGDLGLVSIAPDTNEVTARVVTGDAAYKTSVAGGSLQDATLTSVSAERLLGRAAGDVTGDRRADLVQLVQTDDGVAIEVIVGSAAGFVPAVTWWSDANDPATLGDGTYRLVVTDFTGDGKADAGILRIRPGETPSSSLYVAASTGTRLAAVKRTWTAALDLSSSEVRAGDLSGDGLGDLVALSPIAEGGADIRVASSKSPTSLGALKSWGTEVANLDSIRAIVGDVNRDGRDDVIVVRRSGVDALRILVYRSMSSGSAFSRIYLTDPLALSFAGTRFSSADLNGDGRADLAGLVDRGVDADGNPLGADGWRFLSSGTALSASKWFTSSTTPWATTFPY
jgi:hypothetical protein